MGYENGKLKCDGWCQRSEIRAGDVAMIDRKGYAYCEPCGLTRRESGVPCRKLRPSELKRLLAGTPLTRY